MNWITIDEAVDYVSAKLKIRLTRLHLLTEIQSNSNLEKLRDGLNFKVCAEQILEHYKQNKYVPIKEQIKINKTGSYCGRWEEEEDVITDDEFNQFINKHFKE